MTGIVERRRSWIGLSSAMAVIGTALAMPPTGTKTLITVGLAATLVGSDVIRYRRGERLPWQNR